MNSKEIAAQLKILSSVKDRTLWLLRINDLLNNANLSEVIKAYQEIIAGGLKVAEVLSTVHLTDEQQETIKKAVQENFFGENLVFVFNVDPGMEKALRIKVDDNILELGTKLNL